MTKADTSAKAGAAPVADGGETGGPGVFALGAVAVVCGTGLMAMEIAGARLLEPYMGTSIYVWGSIIGVFMIALTLGYFVGGRLADRNPRLEILGLLILAAGLCCFVIPSLSTPLCRAINAMDKLPVPMRALLASLTLFLLPSALLGVVSPYVLRLAARRLASVGRLAGSLYAASSLGSILGTFAASFVLPELVGSTKTVWGVGAVLALTGLYAVFAGTAARRRAAAGGEDGDGNDAAGGKNGGGSKTGAAVRAAAVLLAVGGAGAGVAAGAWSAPMPPVLVAYWSKYDKAPEGLKVPPADVLEVRESAYHLITIIEGDSMLSGQDERVPARYMLFNNQMESGIELESPSRTANGSVATDGRGLTRLEEAGKPITPTRTACGYVHMLHLGMVATGAVPKRVLVIGCGGGVGPLMMRDHFAGAIERVDVVDIDAAVFELARDHFGFPYSPTTPAADAVIHAYVEDGRLFMQNRPDERWDYIVMDAYTSGGRIPKHLITKEFFDLARSRLNPGGLVLGNIISGIEPIAGAKLKSGDPSRLIRSVYKTMSASFSVDEGGQLLLFPRANRGTSFENIIVAAFPPGRERIDSTALSRLWASAKRGFLSHLPLDDFIGRARLSPPATDDVPLLTDDFCPTDSMSGL